MKNPLISLVGLSKYYTGKQSVVIGVHSIDLSMSRGEFIAITGESGSGKSTLSSVIGGILPYESGEMLLSGNPTSHYDSADWERYRRDNISFISQNYGILPGASVLANVVTALRLSGMAKKDAKEKARDILQQVELWDLRRRRAAKLSSGQKQRLSIARALAKPAPILIADEPTGNLDPENSAKIIQLLHQAAQDRLVILVTHEFSEAEDYATRHIVLQDGRLVMDAQLRPAMEPGPMPAIEKTGKAPLAPFVARLQQTSRPVWSSLVTLFFALTAFGVFAFLGAFIIALDDTSTRLYDNSVFRNGAQTRIVAATLDGSPMSQADYDRILAIEHVASLETNGYVSDVRYAYRENVDYKQVYQELFNGSDYFLLPSYEILGGPYMHTIPVLPQGETFLAAGRLPENMYEVVLAGPESRIGETLRIFITNQQYWAVDDRIEIEATIVGTTDHGSHLYFHRDWGRMFQMVALTDNHNHYFLPMADLADDEFYSDPSIYNLYRINLPASERNKPQSGSFPWKFYKANAYLEDGTILSSEDTTITLNAYTVMHPQESGQEERVLTFHGGPMYLVYVSPANFQTMTISTPSEQVSLTIADYGYTDQVVQSLKDLGYAAVSPYQQGSNQQDPEKAEQRMQTLTVCLLALLAVVALQILLLRALFTAQTESYRLLSNIGLTSATAKGSILLQILAFTLLGQLLGYGAIRLCGEVGVERIVHILHYLPGKYLAILSAVHLSAGLLAALWVMSATVKQVFPLAGKFSDLSLEEEAAV